MGPRAKVAKTKANKAPARSPSSDSGSVSGDESNESNYRDESEDQHNTEDDDGGDIVFESAPTKGKKRKSTQPPKKQTTRKYTKRKDPYDDSLMFSRAKYIRSRELWVSTDEYVKAAGQSKEISLLSKSKTAHFLSNIQIEALESWLAKKSIGVKVFEEIIVRDVDEQNSQMTLQPFEGKLFPRACNDSVKSNNDVSSQLESLDLVINCSGPIQTISFERFCKKTPEMIDDDSLNFSIVVGLSRVGWPSGSDDYERAAESESYETLKKHFNIPQHAPLPTCSGRFGSCSDYPRMQSVKESHDNLLQIWSTRASNTSSSSSSSALTANVSISLNYFVALDECGSIIKVIWNSNLAFEDESLLGLAAVLTSSGKVFILHLPKSVPGCATSGNVSTASGSNIYTYGSLPVVHGASLEICEFPCQQAAIITSIAWVNAGFTDLCCGMSDGSIVVWTVNNCLFEKEKSPILLFRMADGLADFRSNASNSILSIDCCPFQPSVFLTGSADGTLKMWDMKEPNMPVYTKKTINFALTNVQWDLTGYGCYFNDIDNTIVNWESLWNIERLQYGRVRGQLYRHSLLQGSTYGLAHGICNDQSLVISCATDGSVRCGFTSLLGTLKTPTEALVEIFCIDNVENSPETSSSTNINKTKIVSVSRKERLVNEKSIENKINDRFEKYLRSVDLFSFMRPNDEEEVHVFAYGGETGIVRMHSLKVVSKLVAKEVQK